MKMKLLEAIERNDLKYLDDFCAGWNTSRIHTCCFDPAIHCENRTTGMTDGASLRSEMVRTCRPE